MVSKVLHVHLFNFTHIFLPYCPLPAPFPHPRCPYRLGSLTCFLSFEDLQLVLLWGSMEQHLLECMANGLVSPRGQVSTVPPSDQAPTEQCSGSSPGDDLCGRGQFAIKPSLVAMSHTSVVLLGFPTTTTTTSNAPCFLSSPREHPWFSLNGPALLLQLAQALLERLHSGDQTAMAPTELHAWRGLVPAMGMIFLQGLSDSQLEAFLAELQATQLSPAQVSSFGALGNLQGSVGNDA